MSCCRISIHALREEGDSKDGTIAGGAKNFNPRPPRGGRPKQQNYFIPRQVFQSTPSARRATLSSAAKPRRASNFNPRPPRGGRRTAAGPRGRAAKNFNPRPPRGGRPVPSGICVPGVPVFQSTPSARRATTAGEAMPLHLQISIHALREEGDDTAVGTSLYNLGFQSTPSARRATVCSQVSGLKLMISIHALREEGDTAGRG